MKRKPHFGLDGGRLLLGAPTVLLVALFFVAPLALIAVYSLGTTSLVTFVTHFGWTLRNYSSLHDSLYLGTIERSLILSASATLACATFSSSGCAPPNRSPMPGCSRLSPVMSRPCSMR